jgi:guanylate kinase
MPGVRFSVSYTTRAPRRGEVDGQDYHFITEADFRRRIEAGEFAEWAENYGNLYGTSAATMREFLERGDDLLLDVDTRGARALKKNFPGGIYVFILPPDLDALRSRLSRRGSEARETMERRFSRAVAEIREAYGYDYVVCNDVVENAVECIRSIYMAELCRTARWTGIIEKLIPE